MDPHVPPYRNSRKKREKKKYSQWTILECGVRMNISSACKIISVRFSKCASIVNMNPLTVRVVEAPQMFLQPFFFFFFCSPFFPVLHRPLGLAELQACPFPEVVFPPLSLPALPSSPFYCALQDGFGQTWWTGNVTIPLQFASFCDRQEVFVLFNCLLDLGVDFLVGNMVFVWNV